MKSVGSREKEENPKGKKEIKENPKMKKNIYSEIKQ